MREYNLRLKKETIKEAGKFLTDTAKVIIAIGVITPFIKDGEEFSFTYLAVALILALLGLLIFNAGGENTNER